MRQPTDNDRQRCDHAVDLTFSGRNFVFLGSQGDIDALVASLLERHLAMVRLSESLEAMLKENDRLEAELNGRLAPVNTAPDTEESAEFRQLRTDRERAEAYTAAHGGTGQAERRPTVLPSCRVRERDPRDRD